MLSTCHVSPNKDYDSFISEQIEDMIAKGIYRR